MMNLIGFSVAELAPYFYGAALVLTYQLLRSQKRKLMAFG